MTGSASGRTAAQRLLQVGRIYTEPEARGSARGQEILARFPDAEIVEVDLHWQILELHGNAGNVVNLGWHPKAEDVLWRPEVQQAKRSESGMWNVRYRNDVKRAGVQSVTDLIAAHAPWLRILYAF